jgi:hypothetical protein
LPSGFRWSSRARLIGQLTESMLLAIGGILGMVFSSWLARAVFVLVNPIPGTVLQLDPSWLLYGVALSLTQVCLACPRGGDQNEPQPSLEGMSGLPARPAQRIWLPKLAGDRALAVSLMPDSRRTGCSIGRA